uniref:PID domain-containing protein n=1 Tax=Ficedula albicollis TaxID=59894 RepID=A0A803WD58_FICAL
MRVSQSQESVLLGAGSNTAAGSHGSGGSGRTSCGAAGTWLLRAFVFAELPESWADMQEPLLEGMCFTLKYLGMTLVEKPKGEDMAAAAIRRIVATARVGARKFQKVILTVSPRGISLQDADTKEMVENISIYRISYCTTDKLQNKVFAYVAQSQESGALECHAFLSPKKKIAQAVTLTVAQAFQMALDLWETTHGGSYLGHGHGGIVEESCMEPRGKLPGLCLLPSAESSSEQRVEWWRSRACSPAFAAEIWGTDADPQDAPRNVSYSVSASLC